MRFATGLPITAMSDPIEVRDYAQALDGAGFDILTTSGHVLSAPVDRYEGRPNPSYAGPFYDPFVTFSYLAAVTEHIGFMTSILIAPLYPTALLAKQAAELAWVSNGRFELGVGISWQDAEYQALGQNRRNRGRRLEEQIALLREMWTRPYVSFEGRYHHLDEMGLNRLPQTKIPIWMGAGTDEPLLRRVARLADGWLPLGDPIETAPRLLRYVEEAGRDPTTFGISGRIVAGPEGPKSWVAAARRLADAGVTQLTIGVPPDEGLRRLIEAKETLSVALNL